MVKSDTKNVRERKTRIPHTIYKTSMNNPRNGHLQEKIRKPTFPRKLLKVTNFQREIKIENDNLVFTVTNETKSTRNRKIYTDIASDRNRWMRKGINPNKVMRNKFKYVGIGRHYHHHSIEQSKYLQNKNSPRRVCLNEELKPQIEPRNEQTHRKSFWNENIGNEKDIRKPKKQNRRISSISRTCIKSETSPHLPVVSVCGFDRLIHPTYSKFGKFIWISTYLICMVLCFYFIKGCVVEYAWGEPAISVEIIQESSIPTPFLALCPADVFGKNVFTLSLREKFCSIYQNSSKCSNINNIDLVDIFDPSIMTQEDIWEVYNYTLDKANLKMQCSSRPIDTSCLEGMKIETLKTAGGNCLLATFESNIISFGPISQLFLYIDFRNVYGRLFMPFDFHSKIVIHDRIEDVTYYPLDFGIIAPLFAKANAVVHPTKIVLLNTSVNPCFDGITVQNCIKECLTKRLYSEVKCRLPYMKSTTLPDCLEKKEFSHALEVNERILANRSSCVRSCPPICETNIYSLNFDIIKILKIPILNVSAMYYDQKIRTIREYHWYSFFNLLADIGGNLGFFLDISLLSLLEIFHLIYFFVKRNTVPNIKKKKTVNCGSQFLRRTSSNTHEKFQPIISIVGINRLLSYKVTVKRKIFWIICIVTSTVLCSWQIKNKINDYLHGEPATRVTFEVNNTVKFPTFTFCPFRPFEDYPAALRLKEQYLYDYNVSERSYKFSDLTLLEDFNISDLWDEVKFDEKWIELVEVNCKSLLKIESFESAPPPVPKYVKTILGTCISVTIETEIRYHSVGTLFCASINPGSEFEGSQFGMTVFIHDDEDDPRTLDLDNSLILTHQLFHLISMDFVKLDFLSYLKKPCTDSATVSSCKSKCLDDYLSQKMPCRLPFVKNASKPYCVKEDEFNISMTIARELYSKKMLNYICKCPRKCKEYLITALNDKSSIDFDINISINLIAFYFTNNIFSVIKQYRQLNLLTLFSGISGSLGLFLGMCGLSLLELIEFIILKIARKCQ